jgi:DNA-binding XRE family transcriptional regulator
MSSCVSFGARLKSATHRSSSCESCIVVVLSSFLAGACAGHVSACALSHCGECPKAFANRCTVSLVGASFPVSIRLIVVGWIPAASPSSSCVQGFWSRSVRTTSPIRRCICSSVSVITDANFEALSAFDAIAPRFAKFLVDTAAGFAIQMASMLFTLIKERRTRRLTQAQLAAIAGLHPVTLSRIETGKQAPERSSRDSLCKALSLTEAALFPELALRNEPAA